MTVSSWAQSNCSRYVGAHLPSAFPNSETRLVMRFGWLVSISIFQRLNELVSCERFQVSFDQNAPWVKNEQGRFLQLDTGNRPDINSTQETCRLFGSKFQCFISNRITAQDGTYTDFEAEVSSNGYSLDLRPGFTILTLGPISH